MISLIVAKDKNGVIGKENKIPWYLPADLSYFKSLTRGHAIIMGRKTFESIGKVLPQRTNIVITRNKEWNFPGCHRADNLADALEIARKQSSNEEIFVIGGGEIFKEAILNCERLYVTEVDTEVLGGDIFFPEIKRVDWQETSREKHLPDAKNQYGYSFVVYNRIK